MKILIKFLSITLIILTTSCGYHEMIGNLIPKEESNFAKDYLQKIRDKDFDYVKSYLDKEIIREVSDRKISEVADYFPKGDLLSTEIVGSQVHILNSAWKGNFSFEYQFTGGWALANVVLKKVDGKISVIGFNVYQTQASQKDLNAFTLSNKTWIHYLFLAMSIIVPLFILVSTYFCARTLMQKRKWLWIIFILVGISAASINWTTGQYGIQLLSFNLLGASVMASSDYSPWIISVSIPLGAIIFWFKRKGFIQAVKSLGSENN